MFIIVDLGALIIFLAILGIGLGYTIISNIGPILFMITAIIAFFGGGYIFFSGFTKKTISHKIATCVKGLMIMTIFMYVLLMIDSAAWGDNLSKGSYIVIGHFDFLMKNIFFTSLIVGLVLIEVALIPGQIKVLADITSKKVVFPLRGLKTSMLFIRYTMTNYIKMALEKKCITKLKHCLLRMKSHSCRSFLLQRRIAL